MNAAGNLFRPPAAATSALGSTRQQIGKLWQGRAPRERQMTAAALLAVLALVVWLLLLQPALRTLREAPAELDRLDRQLQQLQLAAGEVQGLRGAAPVPTEQAAAALRAATAQLGDKARLVVQGDRATVTFTSAPAGSAARLAGRSAQRRARPTARSAASESGHRLFRFDHRRHRRRVVTGERHPGAGRALSARFTAGVAS